jgi:hypothetical protein
MPVIKALLRSPSNRNVRIHDKITYDKDLAIESARKCLADQFSNADILDMDELLGKAKANDYKTAEFPDNVTVDDFITSHSADPHFLSDLLVNLDTSGRGLTVIPSKGHNGPGRVYIDSDQWISCVEDYLNPVKKSIKSKPKQKSVPKKDSDDAPVVAKG